jgi:hypothetical protein
MAKLGDYIATDCIDHLVPVTMDNAILRTDTAKMEKNKKK